MAPPEETTKRESCRWLLEACRAWILHKAEPGQTSNSTLDFEGTDADTLEEMAHFHNLEPILHDLLRRQVLAEDQIPKTLQTKWEKAYFNTFIRNTEILDMLSHLLEVARKKHFPLAVLKGPSAIADVYGDIGLRPMADLDILCLKQNLPELRDIVRSLGFTRVGEPYLHQLDFYNEKTDTLIEFHFNLFHFMTNKRRFLKKAWAELSEASIDDLHFPVLSLEHRIVFDLAHISFHRYSLALKHFLDFSARLYSSKDILDRKKLLFLLNQTGLTKDFAFLSRALKDLLNLPLAEDPFPVRSQRDIEIFKMKIISLGCNYGFIKEKRTAGEFKRQEGGLNKFLFSMRRLFPPLRVLEAAYDLSSPFQAANFIPAHLFKLYRSFRKKIKSGF